MARKLLIGAALLGLFTLGGTLFAQDARAVLRAAEQAMGPTNLRTIQYSADGWNAAVGQSFSPQQDWPRFLVSHYTRTIDYGARFSREEITRAQGDYPPLGGGGTPLPGEQRQVFLLSGKYAWNLEGQKPVPQPGLYLAGIPVAEYRQLEILLTPHGFLKGAAEGNATATSLMLPASPGVIGQSSKMTLVSFTAMGKYRLNGMFNEQNLLVEAQTWIPNPFYGDMLYELHYARYEDFNGVKFPLLIHVHQGEPRLNVAHNYYNLGVTEVHANVAVPAVTVPDSVQKATAPPERVQSQRLTDGVWLIGGGSHNSVAVEFRDFVTVIEAPLNEDRSLAVIAEVNRIMPNKAIRYVVNTHHHFDHSGGLRTYLAHGAMIITHQGNKEYYERVLFGTAPRTLQPDLLSAYYPFLTPGLRTVPMETVTEEYAISDGIRTINL
jgi:hypothetical protein